MYYYYYVFWNMVHSRRAIYCYLLLDWSCDLDYIRGSLLSPVLVWGRVCEPETLLPLGDNKFSIALELFVGVRIFPFFIFFPMVHCPMLSVTDWFWLALSGLYDGEEWVFAITVEDKRVSVCLQVVGVSSVTGSGLDDFFVQVAEAAVEYDTWVRWRTPTSSNSPNKSFVYLWKCMHKRACTSTPIEKQSRNQWFLHDFQWVRLYKKKALLWKPHVHVFKTFLLFP